MADKKIIDPRFDEDPTLEEELDEDFEENVDAKPQDLQGPVSPIVESGLSVDPDDLGKQWLGTATEQGNFESSSIEPEEEIGVHIKKFAP